MQTQYYAGWDGGGTKTLCRVFVSGWRRAAALYRRCAQPQWHRGGSVRGHRGRPAAQYGRAAGRAGRLPHAVHRRGGHQQPGHPATCKMPCRQAATTARSPSPATSRPPCTGPSAGRAASCSSRAPAPSATAKAPMAAKPAAAAGGSLMDDEGGGFALGRDALAAVVRAEDGRIAPTVLHDAVFEALQVGTVRELIGRIYAPGFGKREVAALAPLVGAAAEQGRRRRPANCGKRQAESWPCWCAR